MGKGLYQTRGNGVSFELSDLDALHLIGNDLRLPLTHLANSASLLASTKEGVAASFADTQQLEHLSRRMIWLIDGMLMAALVQNKQLQLSLQPTNVAAIAYAMYTELRPLAGFYSKELHLSVASAIKPAAADREALAFSIHGLLDLFIRTSQSPVISITINHQVDSIRLSIRDSGPAFSSFALKQVNSRLGRSLQPIKQLAGTSGTPLYVASTLTRSMGGKLSVRYAAGQRYAAINVPISSQLELV